MIYEYTEEKTILTPLDTRVEVKCWLGDCRFINEWNRYDEYYFTFYPQTLDDHQLLCEAGEAAVTKLLMSVDPYSMKEARASYENRNGSFYCSQLFMPKLNVDFEHHDQLLRQQASLKLHFRDDPLGKVYLQAEYVDLYTSFSELAYHQLGSDQLHELSSGSGNDNEEDDW